MIMSVKKQFRLVQVSTPAILNNPITNRRQLLYHSQLRKASILDDTQITFYFGKYKKIEIIEKYYDPASNGFSRKFPTYS
jgi:hypothetical protein